MSTRLCFVYRLMENIADRRQVASHSKGRTKQESDNDCGYRDKNKFFEMACHFAYTLMSFLVSFVISNPYANARRDSKCR